MQICPSNQALGIVRFDQELDSTTTMDKRPQQCEGRVGAYFSVHNAKQTKESAGGTSNSELNKNNRSLLASTIRL